MSYSTTKPTNYPCAQCTGHFVSFVVLWLKWTYASTMALFWSSCFTSLRHMPICYYSHDHCFDDGVSDSKPNNGLGLKRLTDVSCLWLACCRSCASLAALIVNFSIVIHELHLSSIVINSHGEEESVALLAVSLNIHTWAAAWQN